MVERHVGDQFGRRRNDITQPPFTGTVVVRYPSRIDSGVATKYRYLAGAILAIAVETGSRIVDLIVAMHIADQLGGQGRSLGVGAGRYLQGCPGVRPSIVIAVASQVTELLRRTVKGRAIACIYGSGIGGDVAFP